MADLLNTVANVSQLVDLGLNLKQVSNDEIMKALEYQNQEYLMKIIERLDNIEKKLKEIEK